MSIESDFSPRGDSPSGVTATGIDNNLYQRIFTDIEKQGTSTQTQGNDTNLDLTWPTDSQFFCGTTDGSKDTPEKKPEQKPEERKDQKIKDTFGSEVFDHLKDWDWLIDNREKLEDGFKKLKDDEKWDVAWRMNDLSKVDGKSLIYLTKLDSNTRGNLIPKRYDIMLRRGSLRSDNYISHLHH